MLLKFFGMDVKQPFSLGAAESFKYVCNYTVHNVCQTGDLAVLPRKKSFDVFTL